MTGTPANEEGSIGFEVVNLEKSFNGVPVLRGVDLSVRNGEIHALLGANGAGKSTLIKCVSGAETPTSGRIVIQGDDHAALTPGQSRAEGVAVIYQTPSLALSLNVFENLFLGIEPSWGPFRRIRQPRLEARQILRSLGSTLSPDQDLDALGNADLQVIEIAKALMRKPRVLILDEPTSALTKREVDQLAARMRSLRDQGLPMLFVTHRISEALELADRVSILRAGEIVLSGRTSELTREDLVNAIAGRTLSHRISKGSKPPKSTAVLEVTDVAAPGLGPVSFTVREGEVVGLYGLTGSGRTELLEALAGAHRLTSGHLSLRGSRVRRLTPAGCASVGIALVPSDRLRKSIFPTLSAETNMLLPSFGRLARARTVRRRREERRVFSLGADMLNLSPRAPRNEASTFSGGNQQKLVIGRWLNSLSHVSMLMLDEPTDGVDVGARDDLYVAIEDFASAEGRAVLFASSEPEELLGIADRVIVLSRGLVAGVLEGDQLTEHTLLELAHAGEPASETKENA